MGAFVFVLVNLYQQQALHSDCYLIFSRFNPTCDKWIPSKISWVDVQDSGPGHCGWGGSSQIGNLKHLLNKLLCKFFFHQMDQN